MKKRIDKHIDRRGDSEVAVIESSDVIVKDASSVADLMAQVRDDGDFDKLLIRKEYIDDNFFDFKTRIAGKVLQRFMRYHVRIAIVGDFDNCPTKGLKGFIRECNRGERFFFLEDEKSALDTLHKYA